MSVLYVSTIYIYIKNIYCSLTFEVDDEHLKVKLVLALIISTLFTESAECSNPFRDIHIRPTFQINGK